MAEQPSSVIRAKVRSHVSPRVRFHALGASPESNHTAPGIGGAAFRAIQGSVAVPMQIAGMDDGQAGLPSQLPVALDHRATCPAPQKQLHDPRLAYLRRLIHHVGRRGVHFGGGIGHSDRQSDGSHRAEVWRSSPTRDVLKRNALCSDRRYSADSLAFTHGQVADLHLSPRRSGTRPPCGDDRRDDTHAASPLHRQSIANMKALDLLRILTLRQRR